MSKAFQLACLPKGFTRITATWRTARPDGKLDGKCRSGLARVFF
jgi:hypothetical protein